MTGSTNLAILIMVSQTAQADPLTAQLRKDGYSLIYILTNWADFPILLENIHLDAIILNLSTQSSALPRLTDLLREQNLNIPVIGIVDSKQEDLVFENLAAVLDDYLFSDRLGQLGKAITRAVEYSHLRQESRRNEEQARYQILFERSHDIMLFVRMSDGHILEANRAAEKAYGYTRDELLALTILDLRDPITQAAVQGQMYQASTSGIVFETVHRRKDGTPFPVETSSIGTLFEGYRVNLSIIRDISLRKQTEARLAQSEAGLRKAQAISHVGSWRWDIKNNQLEWSDEMYRIFGINREQFSGDLAEVIARAIHPDDREKVNQANRSVTDQAKPIPLEYRLVWPDGSVHWVWGEAGEIGVNENGQAAELSGYVQDISARKQFETALLQSETQNREKAAELQAIMDAVPAFVWVSHNRNCQEMTGNQYGYDLLGLPTGVNLSLSALNNEIPNKFVVTKNGEPILPAAMPMQIAAATGIPQRDFEYDVVFEDNRTFHLFGNAQPLTDNHGNVAGVVGIFLDITELKRAQEAIRQSEEKFRNLFNNAEVGMYRTRIDGSEFLDMNKKYLEIFGRTREEMLGSPSITYWADLREREEFVRRLNLENNVQDFECRMLNKKGEVRICLASGKLFPAQGILEGSLIDITERKRSEDKLRESEARFRATVYSIGDGVITTDDRGRMVHMNPVAEQLTGWGESEAKGIPANTIFNFLSEDGKIKVSNPIDRALKAGVVVNLANHTWLESRDGTRRPIADSAAPIRDKTGEVIGAVLVFRDQTSELQVKKALEENERKYRQLFENLIAGLALHEIILDPEGIPIDYCFLEVNVAFEQLTGLKSLDIIGHTVREIIPTIEDKWIQNYGKVAITGIPMVFDDYNAALDRYYHVMAYCPRIGQFAAIFTDITAQKRNQILTQQMNAELERRVHERTAQLESVNRELESFAHSVSHDLRAPLRSMRGFSSIVLEEYKDVLDSVGVDYLTRIKDSAQWMDQLINDLLELSRVTRANFNDQKVDLSALVRTIETELEAQYSERQVNWIIQEGVEVYGDDHLLHIALLNLLDNALKFTSRRTDAQIEFGAIFQNGETTYWIRDNGVGFDMTYADKLFQPFQRLHPVNEFSGTGIGLATVKRIITRHDGQIWVESSPNHGTTFYFSLGMKNPNRKS